MIPISSQSKGLTPEQLQRMEENKQRALQKRRMEENRRQALARLQHSKLQKSPNPGFYVSKQKANTEIVKKKAAPQPATDTRHLSIAAKTTNPSSEWKDKFQYSRTSCSSNDNNTGRHEYSYKTAVHKISLPFSTSQNNRVQNGRLGAEGYQKITPNEKANCTGCKISIF